MAMTQVQETTRPRAITAADGTELYHKDWGSGPAVVLIHGWPLSADSWDDQAVQMASAGYRTIAYDRRGFGRSSQPWSGYDYDTLADDLAAVIEQTGATDITLVGFSMGGGEVARYMSRHGGRHVRKAVLVSAVTPFLLKTDDNPDGVPQSVFDSMAEGLVADRAKFFGSFFKDFFGVGALTKPVSDELLDSCRTTAMQASLKATLACAQAFSTTDFRADLAQFRVPTLIIHGTDDKTVPIDVSGRAALQLIPGASMIEYDGAPHGLFATRKEQLTQDLLDFLAR